MKINNDILEASWSSIDISEAPHYLHYYPKDTVKKLGEFINRKVFDGVLRASPSLTELGCGNAQHFSLLNDMCGVHYCGVDFSKNLCEAAVAAYGKENNFNILHRDIYETSYGDDIILISHLMELISSPSLLLSKCQSKYIAIRWYEPPLFDHDIVELLPYAHPGSTEKAPFLRRKMGKGYYKYLLERHSLSLIEEHSGHNPKDVLHILEREK